jgi:hypothetical protein
VVQKNKLIIIILFAVLILSVITLTFYVFPDLSIGVAGSLIASLITLVIIFIFNLNKTLPSTDTESAEGLSIWGSRKEVQPSLKDRIRSAKKSIYYVGFTFETALIEYRDCFKDAIKNNNKLDVRFLLIHPDSMHIRAHQDFTDRDIKVAVLEVVNKRMQNLFKELSESEKKRLRIRATHYLPRFAARVFDKEVILINFYLYKSKAQVNPVIEIRRDTHAEEFDRISNSLDELFDIDDNDDQLHPNHLVTKDGEWFGVPG